MKSILILILGCLPLSVLTVWSFVELSSIDAELERGTWEEDGEVPPAVPNSPPIAPFVEELAEADFFSGEAPAALRQLPDESSFAPMKESWPKWTAARQMVARFLQVERLTRASTARPFDQTPLEDLEAAEELLGASRRAHEALKEKYQELRQECQNAVRGAPDPARSPSGALARGLGPLVALSDRRLAELDRRIEQCDKRLEAARLLKLAREAFQPEKFRECVEHCDKLLSGYRSVLTPSEAAKVSMLGERARFRDDVERLFSELKRTDALAERGALLRAFLSKHGDRAERTTAEKRVLDACEQNLREVTRQLETAAADRAAKERIEVLQQTPPATFDGRLKNAVRIVESYPTDSVKSTLRQSAGQWLREFLPEKRISEAPEFQEAETVNHQIVRGFFAEAPAPDGSLYGYKRYPTLEALADPGFDVGTYRREEFLAPPGPSVPRRCVTRFNEARDRLLEAPNRRASWVELADLCESLEAELDSYRTKKGSSPEAADLSFREAGRFARKLLDGSGWADLETLFGGG